MRSSLNIASTCSEPSLEPLLGPSRCCSCVHDQSPRSAATAILSGFDDSMIRHLSRPNGVNHKNESGRSTPRSSSPAVEIELAPPSRLHPVTAIDRQSPSTSVTCTYIPKVQHKSPGHLACKAPRGVSPSALTSAATHDFVVLRAARAEAG